MVPSIAPDSSILARQVADANTFVYVLYKMCSGGRVDKGQFNGALTYKFSCSCNSSTAQAARRLSNAWYTNLSLSSQWWQLDERISAHDLNQWEELKSGMLKVLI